MRALMWLALALAVTMAALSAHIRLAESGLGCEPWPACFGSGLQIDDAPGITIGPQEHNQSLKALHRVLASLFGFIALLLLTFAWWYRADRAIRGGATVVFALTLLLAWVGMRSPDVLFPLVTLLNLGGGMLLVAVLCWMLLRPWVGRVRDAAVLCLVLVCILSGAWVSANFAAGACDPVDGCRWSAESGHAFSPDRALALQGGAIIIEQAQSDIMIVHLVLAGFVTLAVAWMTVRQARRGQRGWWFPASIVLALVALGFFERDNPGVAAASAHNILSILLLMAMVLQAFKPEREVAEQRREKQGVAGV